MLDGIAMFANASTSLKKARSYRAVEILLVDNPGSQKVIQKSPFGSGADVADRHHVPEVIHEVLPINRSSFLDEKSKEIRLGTALQTVNKSLKSFTMRRFQCMKSRKIAMQGIPTKSRSMAFKNLPNQ